MKLWLNDKKEIDFRFTNRANSRFEPVLQFNSADVYIKLTPILELALGCEIAGGSVSWFDTAALEVNPLFEIPLVRWAAEWAPG